MRLLSLLSDLISDNNVSKVPIVMQMEAAECGAACLDMILCYHGHWASLEEVRYECGVSRNGSNAKNIVQAARRYGMRTYAFRLEPEELREDGSFPCIIHWNFHHFVVLCGFQHGRAILNDPEKGRCVVSADDFDRSFTGVCMFFEPGEEFVARGKEESMFSYARKRLAGERAVVVFVLLTTLIGLIFGIINPTVQYFFVDRLFSERNPSWVLPFVFVVSVFAVMQILLSWVEIVYLTRVRGRFGIAGCTKYLWHVMHLPMDFFSQRLAGSIDQRKEVNAEIDYTLLSNIVPCLLNGFMIIVYLAVMSNYSLLLTAIGLTSIVIKLFVQNIVSGMRVNISRVQTRDENILSGRTISGFEMIETIKSTGSENAFFEQWSGTQVEVNNQRQKAIQLSNFLGVVPRLIGSATDAVMLVIGVLLTMRGNFTPGMIMGFQGLMGALAKPIDALSTASQTVREMRPEIEQVEDVLSYPEDVRYTRDELHPDEEYDKLSGQVEMKDVCFGYSRTEPPVLEHFDLSLRPGSRVAIVGRSGCGKSTVGRLLSGLYQPWSGKVLYDGKTIDEIDHSVFTGSVAVADQDITLFHDTIANNIKMWDSSIEDFEMILAARDAKIHEDIMRREGGYRYVIEEGGNDLSGGERQRLEIARVLAIDPTVVILDEATSAMDSQTEYNVVKSIKDRGITCIIISHRLSTIRDCEEILVLDRGHVVERGTHDELIGMNGLYKELVSNA